MSLLTQLQLLLWKNYKLRSRQQIALLVELVWPLILFFILVAVRSNNHPIYKNQCHYPNKPLPSAGVLPWLQGMLCNMQNPCTSAPTLGETPGQVNNFENSTNAKLMSEDFSQWTSVLQNANLSAGQAVSLHSLLKVNESFSGFLMKTLLVPNTTVVNLMKTRVRISQLSTVSAEGDLRSVLCGSSVDRFLEFTSASQKAEFQNVTCSLTASQLLQARQLPLSLGLNFKETSVLMFQSSVHITTLMKALSGVRFTSLLNAADGLDFGSDAFGSLTQLLCGSGLNKTNNVTSRITERTILPTTGAENTRAATAQSNNSPSSNSSDFCKNLTDTLESSSSTRLLWRSFRPFLQGRVLFSPDTKLTRAIVTEANRTFDALAKVGDLAEFWLRNEELIWGFFSNSSQTNTLRTLLQNPLVLAVLDPMLEQAGFSSAYIRNFLSSDSQRPPTLNWQNVFNITSRLAEQITNILQCFDLNKFEGVSSESLLVVQSLKLMAEDRFWAGLVFVDLGDTNTSQAPKHIKYKIRMDVEETERTDKVKERSWSPLARDNPFNDLRYVRGGFVHLQDMVDRGIIKVQTGVTHTLGVYAQQMPYPCYMDDAFVSVIGSMFPMFLVLGFGTSASQMIKAIVLEKERRLKEVLRAVGVRNSAMWISHFVDQMLVLSFPCAGIAIIAKVDFLLVCRFLRSLARSLPLYMTLAWIYSVALIIKGIVQEKEMRLKEAVKMVGLKSSTYWLSWAISSFLPLAVSAALLSVILKFGKVLRYSDPSLIFVFLMVFCMATVMQCFFISVFFSRANLAAACGGLIYFLLYLPHVLCYAWRDVLSFGVKIAASLLSCVAFGFGCENFSRFEEQGIGIQWSNIRQSSQENDRYTFIVSIVMMLFDAVIYGILTWYIENIYPGLLEKPPAGLKAGVCVRNLVKVYKSGSTPAVDRLTLDFYQGQITSFLGHNGAGKTTTMSILTGLFTPSSGTAIINGFDIRTDIDMIRKRMGMCPQHNVLFKDLTVEEHIYFFARLKGRSSKEAKKEIDQMIQDVGLPDKRKERSKNLSEVVILDEPTAGVDPYARRGIWELLLKFKKGRTIILSTHHMDEADILGDRIAIISQGRLCCCGSSLFLKKNYGKGYYLTLERANQYQEAHSNNESDKSSEDEGICSESLSSVEPPAELLESHSQLVFLLPYSGATDGSFVSLFKELDLEKHALGISSYGISDTTLEEIFLKVAEETGVDVASHDKSSALEQKHRSNSRISGVQTISSALESTDVNTVKKETSKDAQQPVVAKGRGSYTITGCSLIKQQFLALMIKRFHHARRSRKGILAQVVLPAFFVCLALIFSLILPPFVEYPNLELQPWMYGAPQNTFYSFDTPGVDQVEKVSKALLTSPGFGTRCMSSNPIPKLPCVSTGGTDWSVPPVDPAVSEIFEKWNWTFQNPSPDCMCSTAERSIILPDCPIGAGGLPPPQRIQNTTDILQNVTGRNITDFLLKTYQKSGKIRFGGFSVGGVNSQVKLNESEISTIITQLELLFNASQFNQSDQIFQTLRFFLSELGTKDNMKVWFYNQGFHSLVSFLNVASNGLLRANLPVGSTPEDFGISTFNHPLNLTKEQLSLTSMAASLTDVVVSICVMFAMSLIPASFVLFLIQERVSKAKHLQFVSGVNPSIYWLTNFTWDMCNYFVPAIIIIIIFLCFQQKAYLVHHTYDVPGHLHFLPYVVLTSINLFIGVNGSIATFIMELFDDPNIKMINDIIKQILLVFPHFCLGRGLMDMAKNQAMANLYQNLGEDRFVYPLTWSLVGKNLFAMFIEGLVMFGFTMLIQYKFCLKPRENERVHQGKAQNDLLQICDLTKIYSRKSRPAVDKVCVGVPAGECFGLLGINGAEMPLVHQNMGYCPQFDAIDDLLTGREHLQFYARLRGVPEAEVSMVAEWGIQKLGLVKHSEKSAGTFSGGNKRKLSTAMALIGCAPLIFLDEPTTGMDPKARRFLWDCILSVIKEGRSVILTSHSMEECEALCSRMAIMVNGRFKCLGSIQHLKSRFGEGYTLIVRVKAQECVPAVESFVRSILKEKHSHTLQYQLPQNEGALTHTFSMLNTHQQTLHIEDFSVFVSFAQQQRDEEDAGAFDNHVDLKDEEQISAM
ncbi:hypothetical protein DNTS_030944 [Danionella cerebrum]|uniref:ABC transporter domain-containing protein n=1 Tax=Danionella cerebrum TaxID=2873325 RepID=A0A553Q5H9_9TELE|nr:hypothetical protein DNTS_030944 [Danionella translucida]